MKKQLQLILMLAFGLSFNCANAQWVQTSCPSGGGGFNCLAASGTKIFAGTYASGIFFSNDNGNTWTTVNNGIATSYSYQSLVINRSNTFTGTYGHGVYLSNNNGSNWLPTNNGISTLTVNSFTIIGNNIFAGTKYGVYLSNDNGNSWIAKNSGFPSPLPTIFSLAFTGNNIFAGTDYGVFLSTNNGNNWTNVSTGIASGNVLSLAIMSNTIIAGLDNNSGVYL